MSTLIGILAVIGLLDSTSLVPICIIPLAAILGGNRPVVVAASFLAGIFLVYASSGVMLLVGFDLLFDAMGAVISRWWNNPNTPELLLQLVVGGIMLTFGWRLARARQPSSHPRPNLDSNISPVRGFALGAGITVLGMPGAFPYFGAIDQILRADLGYAASGIALLFYNLIFILPLALLLLVRIGLPSHSKVIFQLVSSMVDRWGRYIGITVFTFIGAILVADGIGWFLGKPLLPVV